MLTLAVDPDTKAPGFAVGTALRVKRIGTPILAPTDRWASALDWTTAFLIGLEPVQRLIVEGQEIYSSGKADANDLIAVATVAGAVLSAPGFTRKIHPLPKRWKGQQPKGVSQKAALDHYIDRGQGWKYRDNGPKKTPTVLVIPEDVTVFGEIQDWSEALDAIGLLAWGAQQP